MTSNHEQKHRDSVLFDVTPTKYGKRIRVYVVVGVGLTLVTVITLLAAWDIVSRVAPWILGLVVILGLIAALGWLADYIHSRWHNIKRRQAQTAHMENEAAFVHFPATHVAVRRQGKHYHPFYTPPSKQLAASFQIKQMFDLQF